MRNEQYGQQREDPTDAPALAYQPPEDWRVRFQKQAKRPMLEKLNRIARARLGAYAGKKRKVHDSDVDDIVIGALGDTWLGILTWDPEKRPLYLHLKDAIKFRVRNNAKLLRRKSKHDEFDEDERGESLEIAVGAVAPTLTALDDRDNQFAPLADDALAGLRPLAARDSEVTSLIDALAKRIVDRDDILEETGMTITEYNNAFRRLGRLVRQLPAQLRDQALAVLA